MNSDVILIPVTAVQPDLVTQTDQVIYVPLASKQAHGIVKIGDGLIINQGGLLSFDRSEIKINEIVVNGEVIEPDENKIINLESIVKQEALDELDLKITNHINDLNNPHRVTKEQVGLGNVDNTSDADKPISDAVRIELNSLNSVIPNQISSAIAAHNNDTNAHPIIQTKIDEIRALAEGASKAITFENYSLMVDVLNSTDNTSYEIGQHILIGSVNVPDLWIFDKSNFKTEYTYVSDDDMIMELSDGFIHIGYYILAKLETGKVDLENYVTLNTNQIINADKTLEGNLYLNGDLIHNGENITPILDFGKQEYEDSTINKLIMEFEDIVVTNSATIGVLGDYSKIRSSHTPYPLLKLMSNDVGNTSVKYTIDNFTNVEGKSVDYSLQFVNLEPNTKYSFSFNTYAPEVPGIFAGVAFDAWEVFDEDAVVEFTTDSRGKYVITDGLKFTVDSGTSVVNFDRLCLVKGDYIGYHKANGYIAHLRDIEAKVDKIPGKGLSANNYTNADKRKLDGIDYDIDTQTLIAKKLYGKNSALVLTAGEENYEYKPEIMIEGNVIRLNKPKSDGTPDNRIDVSYDKIYGRVSSEQSINELYIKPKEILLQVTYAEDETLKANTFKLKDTGCFYNDVQLATIDDISGSGLETSKINDIGQTQIKYDLTDKTTTPLLLIDSASNDYSSSVSINNMGVALYYNQLNKKLSTIMLTDSFIYQNVNLEDQSKMSMMMVSSESIDFTTTGNFTINGSNVATTDYVESLITTALNTEV